MADSNKSRASREDIHVYLDKDELKQLDAAAELAGESRQVIVRQAIRREIRRIQREHEK